MRPNLGSSCLWRKFVLWSPCYALVSSRPKLLCKFFYAASFSKANREVLMNKLMRTDRSRRVTGSLALYCYIEKILLKYKVNINKY